MERTIMRHEVTTLCFVFSFVLFLLGLIPLNAELISVTCWLFAVVMIAKSMARFNPPLFYIPILPLAAYLIARLLTTHSALDVARSLAATGMLGFFMISFGRLLARGTEFEPAVIEQKPRIILEYEPRAMYQGQRGYFCARLEHTHFGTSACVTRDEALTRLFELLARAGRPAKERDYDIKVVKT